MSSEVHKESRNSLISTTNSNTNSNRDTDTNPNITDDKKKLKIININDKHIPNHIKHISTTSTGTTSVIRKKLNFTDEILWKHFSSRRLQLVESLSLSSKKASEQDEEIKICATTLMREFKFPDSTLPEFDKLVRLAIQSVRRNKKRSEKRLASKLEILTSDDEQHNLKKAKFEINNDKNSEFSNHHHHKNNDNNNNENDNSLTNLNLLSSILIDNDDDNRKICNNSNNNNSDINNINSTNNSYNNKSDNSLLRSTSGVMDFSLINNYNSKTEVEDIENLDSRVAINTLISPIIPDSDKLPSIKKLDENPEFTIASQKVLHAIKNSKSCFEFSKNSGAEYSRSQNYDLLEEFGSSCINSAVLFTLEKWFDHLLPDSSSYIKLRLKSDLTLGLIIKNLDKQSVEVTRLNNYVASQLFKKLIGGCVKDYGFDSTLNPLCDIFHSIILKDYPIIAKDQIRKSQPVNLNGQKDNFFNENSIIDSTFSQPNRNHLELYSTSPIVQSSSTFSIDSKNSNNSSNVNNTNNNDNDNDNNNGNSHNNNNNNSNNSKMLDSELNYSHNQLKNEIPDFPLSTAHIPIPSANQMNSSISIPPPVLRPKQYTNVTIKFKEKELKFRYCMDSNAPPTVLELITNCKQAFGISNSTRILNLRDLRSGNILKTDHELERVLRMAVMLNKDYTGEVVLELVFSNVTQGYLNLNYESTTSSNNTGKDKKLIDHSLIINSAIKNNNNINSKNLSSDSSNNINESSLIGRYLPPPRPIRPDSQPPRNVFMKFQPLL